jgi:glycerol-3-phosphate acyltransferase PlsY
MTTIFLAFFLALWFYRRVDGVDLAAYGAQQLGASTGLRVANPLRSL